MNIGTFASAGSGLGTADSIRTSTLPTIRC